MRLPETDCHCVLSAGGLDFSDPHALRVAMAASRAASAFPGSKLHLVLYPCSGAGSGTFVPVKISARRWRGITPEAAFAVFAGALSALHAGRKAAGAPEKGAGQPVVLLFRSFMRDGNKEPGGKLGQAVFFLASALRRAGVKVVLSDLRLPEKPGGEFEGMAELESLLRANPDINIAGISLLEAYLPDAARLAARLESRGCFVVLGGVFPTERPWHCLAHMPSAHFAVRGAGEDALPELVRAIGASRPAGGLGLRALETMALLKGVLGRCGGNFVLGGPDAINRASLASPWLDMGLLRRRDVLSGGQFSLSRGCGNDCAFCTSFDKGFFHAAPYEAVKSLMRDYHERLSCIFGGRARIPSLARGIGFYDDDFFTDPERAARLLEFFSRGPLYLDFIQSGVRALLRAQAGDGRFMQRLVPAAFGVRAGAARREKTDIYFGSENFCDAELRRLGKGYGTREAERAARLLSGSRIRQAHHLIMRNVFTSPEDVCANLAAVARLRRDCAPWFSVLTPVIGNLRSLYGTRAHEAVCAAGLERCLELSGRLAIKGLPEFDYPLVGADLSASPLANAMADTAARHLNRGDYDGALESALALVAEAWGKLPARSAKGRALENILDRHIPAFALEARP